MIVCSNVYRAVIVGTREGPGLDVDDGLLDHLADPFDTPVRLLHLFARFSVRGFLCGVITLLPTYPLFLSAIGSGEVQFLEQSGRRPGRPRHA